MRILQCLAQRSAKFLLRPRQAGDAAFAAGPSARRGVEQQLLQAMRLQPRGQFLGRVFIGEELFHGLKTIGRGGGKVVEERQLVAEEAQVGGKLGHGGAG